jgi:arylsulfatase A-like enzyme
MDKFRGLSRREFLKLVSLAPIGIYSHPLQGLVKSAGPDNPNVIFLVFDAWSQRHVSLYGYQRQTMPSLEKFAANGTVYHNHYSTGVFTVPGTASLLTGLHPWSHRAFQIGGGVISEHVPHNIFSALSTSHSTLAFTQNRLANQLLIQMAPNLDHFVNSYLYNIQDTSLYTEPLFEKDPRTAFASLEDNLVQQGSGFDSSLFFGPLYRLHILRDRLKTVRQYGDQYPLGLPDELPGLFLLEDVVDGSIDMLKGMQGTTLAYLHFWAPHEPFTPTSDFYGSFADGWQAPEKPIHELTEKKVPYKKLHQQHQYYDEYIANWDAEVGRLFDYLKDSGLMDNSYIVITADHGELFERGELGHKTRLLYDGVVHVPLIVLSPGQTQRQDVYAYTSSVDLLPTLAHLTGNPAPDWAEGKLLPKLGGTDDEKRSLYSMEARTNSSFGPLTNFSISVTRERHRLIHYIYPKLKYDGYEFYDLEADPDEMKDLYSSHPTLAVDMKAELDQKVVDVNRPFQRSGL